MIFCCGCQCEVTARLTDGSEIYPHRRDLGGLPFWKCDACGNYVGCHHKTNNRTRPLGNIPTAELRKARNHIHAILDPLWKDKVIPRGALYGRLKDRLGYVYHTAEIKTIEEARVVYRQVQEIKKDLQEKPWRWKQ